MRFVNWALRTLRFALPDLFSPRSPEGPSQEPPAKRPRTPAMVAGVYIEPCVSRGKPLLGSRHRRNANRR